VAGPDADGSSWRRTIGTLPWPHLVRARGSRGVSGRSETSLVSAAAERPHASGQMEVRDRDMAEGLAIGFDGLWKKAMRDLQ
jgi:hypothetical protein